MSVFLSTQKSAQKSKNTQNMNLKYKLPTGLQGGVVAGLLKGIVFFGPLPLENLQTIHLQKYGFFWSKFVSGHIQLFYETYPLNFCKNYPLFFLNSFVSFMYLCERKQNVTAGYIQRYSKLDFILDYLCFGNHE